jgi:hypothetical protein
MAFFAVQRAKFLKTLEANVRRPRDRGGRGFSLPAVGVRFVLDN